MADFGGYKDADDVTHPPPAIAARAIAIPRESKYISLMKRIEAAIGKVGCGEQFVDLPSEDFIEAATDTILELHEENRTHEDELSEAKARIGKLESELQAKKENANNLQQQLGQDTPARPDPIPNDSTSASQNDMEVDKPKKSTKNMFADMEKKYAILERKYEAANTKAVLCTCSTVRGMLDEFAERLDKAIVATKADLGDAGSEDYKAEDYLEWSEKEILTLRELVSKLKAAEDEAVNEERADPLSTPTSLPTTSQPTIQAQDQQLTSMEPPATISLATQKAREQALAARALKKEEEHTKQLNRMTRENNHLRGQGLIVEKEKEKLQQTVKELERQNTKLCKDVLAEKKRRSTAEASALALQESLRLEKRETLRLSSLVGKPATKETRRQMGVVPNFMVCKKKMGIKTHTQRQERLIALMMKEIIDQKKVMSHPEHTIQILNYTHQSNISQLNSEYQQQIQSLQAELSSANSHLAKLHPQAQEFNTKIEELEIKLKGAQECVSTERNNASELVLTVNSLKIDLNNSASDIKDLKRKLTENNDLETKLQEANAAIEKERTKNVELVNRINGINTDLEERQSKIEDLNEKLKNKGDLESEIQAANDAIGHEHMKNSTFETTIANLKTKFGDLECENKNLEEKRASLEAQLQTALKDKNSGGFGNTEVVLHNADPQEDTAEEIVGLESGHLDNSDPTGSTPNNEQHQKLEVKKGSPQQRSRRADRFKFTRPNTPPPGPRRKSDETEEIYTQRLRLLSQFLLDHNSKLLGQGKGHFAVSILETTQYQNIDEFISDPTECFVAMREKLDAIYSENCELKNEIDQLEDDHSQESKKLNSRVRKLEATVDGLRQEKIEEKRYEKKKLAFREQALTKAENALEQRKKELDSAESELAAVATAESSTDSWDNETDDDGSSIFGDARISKDFHAVEQNSMFADNWYNGGCEVGLQVDNTEFQCPSPVDDIEAFQCPNPVGDIETECSSASGTFPWKLILVDLLVIFLLLAGILFSTIFKQNPPSEQRPPHTCHISERTQFSMPFSLPEGVPILVCLEDGNSNFTPASSLTVPILDSPVSQLPLFGGPDYEPVIPPTASTGFKSWLWEFVVTGAAQGQFGAAAGSSSLYL
jgi:hypothetical protein